MLLNCMKDTFLKAIKKVLNNYFRENKMILEINNRIEEEVFANIINDDIYKYINDICENDVLDKFINLCTDDKNILNFDVKDFVEKEFPNKSNEERSYVCMIFQKIESIIFDVLRNHASSDSKLIMREQKKLKEEILEKISVQNNKDESASVIVVTYCANMQNKNWDLSRSVCSRIDISIKNLGLYPNNTELFWEVEKASLIKNFDKNISKYLDDGYGVDLYALAPIPLLVLLGNLFANRPNINIYQLRKNPSTFEWANKGEKLNIIVEKPDIEKLKYEVAIMMSFSFKVNRSNVTKVVGKMPIVEMSIEAPYDDFLKTKEQFYEFLEEFRKVKAYLISNGVKVIHLFAAIPIAFAIGIGHAYNPNYDAKIITYDFKQDIYTKALTIGESYGHK